jgi:hypothetical protein
MGESASRRSCVFCGAGGKLTAEHVWPAWIDDYIPTIPGGMVGYKHKHGTSDGRFEALFECKRLNHRAKVVCLSCNNGWMNDLENRARRVLKEMISGTGVSLDSDAQRHVASWAAKTAMCVEKTFPTATQAIPQDYYRALYADTSRPPDDLTIWAGCYLGETPFGISHRSWPLWQFVKRQPSNMFQATYRIGHLILQLFGSRSTDDFMLVNDRSKSLLQLWPLLGQTLEWPPKFVFGDEAYERFSAVDFPAS